MPPSCAPQFCGPHESCHYWPVDIAKAQADVRSTYAGGFFGQLVSGAIWLVAAAVSTWVSPEAAIVALFLGGVLIFPLTTLAIRASGRPWGLPQGHPMAALASQIAFTVPLGMLVVIALIGGHEDLFFPASMVIVGAHYLPFVFLYGMRQFAVLAGIMIVAGIAFAQWSGGWAPAAGWFNGILLVAFAFVLRSAFRSKRQRQ